MCEQIERKLWADCAKIIKAGMSNHGFQTFQPKLELQKIYPYLETWEIYYFLKDGYDSQFFKYCKYCGELILQYNTKKEFCNNTCGRLYYHNLCDKSPKLFWEQCKSKICADKNFKLTHLSSRTLNDPFRILGEYYNVGPRSIYDFLKYGVDHQRACPVCGEIIYTGKKFCSIECQEKAEKENIKITWESFLGKEKAEERKQKQIERQTGQKHSAEWTAKMKEWYKNPDNLEKFKKKNERTHTSEVREKQSITIKNNILSGKFTPYNASRKHAKSISYENNHYRSRFELIFDLYMKFILHKNIEYEKVRIEYFDADKQKTRVYIIDFYDTEEKVLYEIKPRCFIDKELKYKLTATLNYCANNNITFQIITEEQLKCYINELYPLIKDNQVLCELLKRYIKQWIEK